MDVYCKISNALFNNSSRQTSHQKHQTTKSINIIKQQRIIHEKLRKQNLQIPMEEMTSNGMKNNTDTRIGELIQENTFAFSERLYPKSDAPSRQTYKEQTFQAITHRTKKWRQAKTIYPKTHKMRNVFSLKIPKQVSTTSQAKPAEAKLTTQQTRADNPLIKPARQTA